MQLSHHAYFLHGPQSLLPKLALSACALCGFIEKGDPDVVVRSYEKFGIDEARQLQGKAALKNTQGRGLFVLGVSSITIEAQQALLKLFEEPQIGITFVLLVPHGALLPTFASRFLPFPEVIEEKQNLQDVEAFLAMSYKERSAFVADLMEEEDEHVRERVREFLNVLERKLYRDFLDPKIKNKGELAGMLSDIAQLRGYLFDRSPSLKMILEHIAAALPTVRN